MKKTVIAVALLVCSTLNILADGTATANNQVATINQTTTNSQPAAITNTSASIIATATKNDSHTIVKVQTLPEHPRLIFMKGEEQQVQALIKRDKRMRKFHKHVLNYADSVLTFPCNQRIKTGMRLLPVSRRNIKYLLYLSYAYRMTHDTRYAKRAKEELVQLANFVDWNPSHYLDVAEMGLAAAIGYDWLYQYLDPATRTLLETALNEKIIQPSLGKYAYNLRRTNNWNQVCNTGTSIAALAIYEKMPEQTIQILNNAIQNLPIVTKEYAPNGAYIEGYNYWGYGTTYNVILIDLLQKLFGSDYQLKSAPGFMETATFHQALVTPALNYYNYGDNKDIPANTVVPAIFWFYKETHNPDLLYNTRKALSLPHVHSDIENDRFYPLALIWAAEANVNLKHIKAPTTLYYQGQGANPIVTFRSDWADKNASFIGFKGGKDRISHGHQDAGSFIFEANQVRWALELGQEDYTRLEQAKLSLWGKDRWKIYRYNCFNHNTFTFNGKPIIENQYIPLNPIEIQTTTDSRSSRSRSRSSSSSNISKNSSSSTISCQANLTPLYANQIKTATRKISLVNHKDCTIQDHIQCSNQDVTLTWRMATETTHITQINPHTIKLHKNNHTTLLTITNNNQPPTNIQITLQPATPPNTYDTPNPNIKFIQIQLQLKANTQNNLNITIHPIN